MQELTENILAFLSGGVSGGGASYFLSAKKAGIDEQKRSEMEKKIKTLEENQYSQAARLGRLEREVSEMKVEMRINFNHINDTLARLEKGIEVLQNKTS